MDNKAQKVSRIVCKSNPEWVEDFGESYINSQIEAVLADSGHTPPRGKSAEETDVGSIADLLVITTNLIINLFFIVDKIESRQDRIAAIKKEVAEWEPEKQEKLVEALLEELD